MLNKIFDLLVKFKNLIVNVSIGIKNISVSSAIFMASWWRGILFTFLLITFLYYPIGAFLVNNIDRNIDYNFTPPENVLYSQSIDTMSHIVDREVNQNVWTPNLPFFFPSAILDNMPNFQLGMFDAMANFSNSFAKNFDDNADIKEIAEQLNYNGKIWMFSPENKISPASSANKMYREARRKLKVFNNELAERKVIFIRRPLDLAFILNKTSQNISKSVVEIERHINEKSQDFTDMKSDDVFYYNQGKLYAYYLLLNALGQDYKEIIVSNNLYSRWVIMTKSLEQASKLEPMMVRNANLNSSFAPNHLNYLGFYGLKSDANMQKIIKRLERL